MVLIYAGTSANDFFSLKQGIAVFIRNWITCFSLFIIQMYAFNVVLYPCYSYDCFCFRESVLSTLHVWGATTSWPYPNILTFQGACLFYPMHGLWITYSISIPLIALLYVPEFDSVVLICLPLSLSYFCFIIYFSVLFSKNWVQWPLDNETTKHTTPSPLNYIWPIVEGWILDLLMVTVLAVLSIISLQTF